MSGNRSNSSADKTDELMQKQINDNEQLIEQKKAALNNQEIAIAKSMTPSWQPESF